MHKQKHNTPIIHKIPSTLSIIKSNLLLILSFFVIAFLVYSNSIHSEFSVIDDIAGYIDNKQITNLAATISSFKLQETVYALNYLFFQINPLPLHVFAIINHSIVAVVLFIIILQLYDKKTAYIASLLFILHPVNTEVLNWVSAQFYTVMALFIYVSLLLQLKFRSTGNKKYIYFILLLYGLDIVLIRHPWVFVLPLAVAFFDYFILEKTEKQQFYKTYIAGVVVLSLAFIFLHFGGQLSERIASRSVSNKTLQNDQNLIPVIQSYPYTVSNMVRLYVFPKDLTVYYDGNKLTARTYFFMYLTFILYIVLASYYFSRNKKIFGLLILLLVFILPVFSPRKITWYITERYLYLGSGFFTTLVALLVVGMEKKFKWKYIAYISAGIIALTYGFRTYARNVDWQNPEKLALATIQTSPYSVRPYNDLAGYYVLQGNYTDAKQYYVKALQITQSLTAIRNLGHVYLETGLDPSITVVNKPEDAIYQEVLRLNQQEDYLQSLFYLNDIIAKNPQNVDAWNRAIEIYFVYNQMDLATLYLKQLEEKQLMNADTYFIQAYIAYSNNDTQSAVDAINKVLELQPNHAGALDLLNHL